MKSKNIFILFAFLFSLVILSCNKISEQDISIIETPTSDHINSISGTTTIRAAGGLAWNSGVILAYENKNFEIIESEEVELRKIKHDLVNNTHTAVGLNGKYYQISDSDSKLHNIPQGQVARDLYYTVNGTILVGGKSYGIGYITHLNDKIEVEKTIEFPYEIRAISAFNEALYVAGFGFVAKSLDDGYTWQKLDLSGDFFLSFEVYNNNRAYIVGQEGKMLKSEDGGITWMSTKVPTKTSINNAKIIGEILYVFCNKGIYHQYNIETNQWTSFDIGSYDILDGIVTQSQLLLVGKAGFAGLVDL